MFYIGIPAVNHSLKVMIMQCHVVFSEHESLLVQFHFYYE